MDAHAIYSAWKEYKRLPGIDTVIDFTIAARTRELEFVAMLYKTENKKLDISSALSDKQVLDMLLKRIPKVWNQRIRNIITISKDILTEHADLRVFVGVPDDVDAMTADVDAITASMKRMSLTKSADEYVAERSKRNIATMAEMSAAAVSMDWVRACASTLKVNSNVAQSQHFILIRPTSDRHVHHVNSSVLDFLKTLHDDFTDVNTLPRTITWQFSHESTTAIHLQKFIQGATKLCPEHPYAFIVFACAIGIPIHELMKTRDIITTWKSSRFKLFNQENVIKVLLRRRFKTEATDIETNTLVRKYTENIADFRAPGQYNDVDMYFFKMFYSYPDVDEIQQLAVRVKTNVLRLMN